MFEEHDATRSVEQAAVELTTLAIHIGACGQGAPSHAVGTTYTHYATRLQELTLEFGTATMLHTAQLTQEALRSGLIFAHEESLEFMTELAATLRTVSRTLVHHTPFGE